MRKGGYTIDKLQSVLDNIKEKENFTVSVDILLAYQLQYIKKNET